MCPFTRACLVQYADRFGFICSLPSRQLARRQQPCDFQLLCSYRCFVAFVYIRHLCSWFACAGAFSGYQLQVLESHQSSKVDVSGTAKAIVGSFQTLGVDFDESQIVKIRDKQRQLTVMDVPQEALSGHAFHTYDLRSPDGSVELVFKHNVVGRTIYAEGTVDAVVFLHKKISEGAEQHVYNMIDVLKEGSLR